MKGRGADANPPNRFEQIVLERDADWAEEDPSPQTVLYKDATRTILAHNDSPDVPFSHSVNPYRGCEHGCIYCYARPTHEYLGLSAGLDFETKLFVKEDAPELLRKEFMAPSWKGEAVAFSGVTDCYQPVERRLLLTRRLLEVCAEFNNPAMVITKSRLVARDADILARLAKEDAALVCVSVTTLDEELRRTLEPRASSPRDRLAAVRTLADAGVPVGVLAAPVIPGLTDHEVPAILEAAKEAGASFAGYVFLRLPHGVGPLFEEWLERVVPGRKKKVLAQVRESRGGELNDYDFGSRMRGEGPYAELTKKTFLASCKRLGLKTRGPFLSPESFRRPKGPQLDLF